MKTNDLTWQYFLPLAFIVLWSTGFIGARMGLPHAEPFTFLALRMGCSAILLLTIALLTRATWPSSLATTLHISAAGLLLQGCFLGGTFWAIDHGLSAGVTAIVVSIQPLLTAALTGIILGERVRPLEWLGLLIGLAGVALVVSNRISADGASASALSGALISLLGITLGTLYQKRFCPAIDIRSGGFIQCSITFVVFAALAHSFETMHVEWAIEFLFALGWLVLAVSGCAVGLLFALLRHGEAAKTASLFYLVPPFTALFGFLFFDDVLEGTALAGLIIVMAGVGLTNFRLPQKRRHASAEG